MTERLVATSRDTLAEALAPHGFLADYLINTGVVRVIDPADPAMVERVRRAVSVLVPDRDGHRDQQVIAVAWEAIAAVLS